MVSWKEILQFDSPVAAMPKPVGQTFENPLDKITGYLKDAKNAQRQNLVDRSNQAKFSEESELRRIQKELADDFSANPPKTSTETLDRSIEFFSRKGQFDKVAQLQSRRETAVMADAQKTQMNEIKKAADLDKKNQAIEKNRLGAFATLAKHPELAAALPENSPILAASGLSLEAVKALAADIKLANEGKPATNAYALLDAAAKSGDPAKIEQAQAIVSFVASASFPSKIAAMQYGYQNNPGLVKTFTTANDTMGVFDPRALPGVPQGAAGMPTPGLEPPMTTPQLPSMAPGGTLQPLGRTQNLYSDPNATAAVPDLSGVSAPTIGALEPPPNAPPPGAFTDTGIKVKTSGEKDKEAGMDHQSAVKHFSNQWKNDPAFKAMNANYEAETKAGAMQNFNRNLRRAEGTDYEGNVAKHTLMYQYLRALDNSVVKPSEIDAFQRLAGGYEAAQQWANRLLYGEPYSEELFKALMASVGTMKQALEDGVAAHRDNFVGNIRVVRPKDADLVLRSVFPMYSPDQFGIGSAPTSASASPTAPLKSAETAAEAAARILGR